MKNIPEKLYLQIGEDADVNDFKDLDEESVTWSSGRVFNNDIEYVRASQFKSGKMKGEESITCPYCNGKGDDVEQTAPDEWVQIPCGYCYANGRVTTELMKSHIESSKHPASDDLPF